MFTYYNDPSVQKHYVSYDAALILVVIVLLLLVASRIVVARTQRHSESARTGSAGSSPASAARPTSLARRRPRRHAAGRAVRTQLRDLHRRPLPPPPHGCITGFLPRGPPVGDL